MDDSLYDEFGNYLGDDLDSDEDDEDQEMVRSQPAQPAHAPLEGYDDDEDDDPEIAAQNDLRISTVAQVDANPQNQVVLHEDKRYYPSAEETYGPDVETRVEEEDTQLISEPIVQPIKERKFQIVEKDLPETRFDRNFMVDLMYYPEIVRNVVVIGHLHHGKTSLLDLLTFQTHKLIWNADAPERYTDLHKLERAREISIKSTPMSFVLESTIGKSILVNAIDTPGHTNFVDEVANATRLADGAIVVVDVVEGVMAGTELSLKHILQQGLKPVLVLNKMERLFLELRLPPSEAYFKVKRTIEEVNSVVSSVIPDESSRLSPELGNVAFASTDMHWSFTLQSFSQMYADTFGSFDVNAFAARLWGNIFFDAEKRKFVKKAPQGSPRSFVHFVLEPLYKLYTQVIGEDVSDLANTLAGLGITLKPSAYKMDARPLLKLCLDQFFGPSTGIVDMLLEHIPSAAEGNATKVYRHFTGPLDTPLAQGMLACDSKAPAVIHVTKLYTTVDAQGFHAFGRVMSGRARVGDSVKVLGEGYSVEDEEDMATATIEDVWVSEARYKVAAQEIPAGSWVLLGGVDDSIVKTSTVVSNAVASPDELHIFRPIAHITESILKVAVEPLNPPELPRLLDGLRRVNKSYPLLTTKVEESGEHIILGTGEIYLDSVLHDLRTLFAEIEIKVSDPVVKFCETVVETSAIKCYADTPNKKNKITIIAEPLEKGIAEDIEKRRVGMWMTNKERGKFFQDKYGWDALASRSIWTFGPEEDGPNVLIDDTLPSEVDKVLLGNVKESIKQGFQWAAREGPLADEPLRGVKFRIMDAQVAEEPIYRGGGQMIPTARRVCYSSFLMATPRLMEPVYYVEMLTTAESVPLVYQLLAKRRGHVTKDEPKAGSPLYVVKALIPVMDANGFETDLRTQSAGTAFALEIFDHWAIVPGDPVDSGIQLRLLEPAPAQHLARDFMLKVRRRKGLGDGQNLMAKYLDDDFVLNIVAAGKSDLLF
ncbi:hypothetical protein E3P96_03679 [Wallemia ichthyophaga]|nr:hypothetical protein E3P98_03205 [Wallemia ichthyophaga]TIA96135.1 hypothetical protein E3P96_03679 [Wallemia ichthyophaga]